MSQERTEAIVLRGVDFSESSRIVTFLTPARGRVAGIAKGARRARSPLSSVLDTFNLVELVMAYKEGREVQTLVEASPVRLWKGLKSDLAKGAYGAVLLEVALKAAHENEPSEAIYGALVEALDALEHAPAHGVEAPSCWGLLTLMAQAGYEPALDACVYCGGAVLGGGYFAYEGGVACEKCRGDAALEPPQREALLRLRQPTYPGAVEGADAGVFRLVQRYAAHQLETELRSARVLEQLTTR